MSAPTLATDGPGDVYGDLFVEAERVRWRMTDIPWDQFEDDKVDDGLVYLVRRATTAEFTTFQATQRFMHEYYDDVDFTQWIAVWFYEETKHPQALMRWLANVGESFTESDVLQARETFPFVKSRIGTLGDR